MPLEQASATEDPNDSYVIPTHKEARQKFLAFEKGFKGNEVTPYFKACGLMSLQYAYYELPVYKVKMHYADFGDSVFNTTLMLQNTSEVLTTCTRSVESFVEYFGN